VFKWLVIALVIEKLAQKYLIVYGCFAAQKLPRCRIRQRIFPNSAAFKPR